MDMEVAAAVAEPQPPQPIPPVQPTQSHSAPSSSYPSENPFKFNSSLPPTKPFSTFKKPLAHKLKPPLPHPPKSLSSSVNPPPTFDSSPNSDPKPSLKRCRSNPSLEVFPSFTAQLSFFTSPNQIATSHSEPHSPSSVSTFNPFDPLETASLLLPEEGNKISQ